MKKTILFLFTLSISCLIVKAQSPEKINYQAIARDIAGIPLVNQTLNVTYQIRQSSPSGASVYTETHTGISTNQFGLFTAEIGGGTPSVGTFAGINWGAGLFYLYVEVNGNPIGSSQLLSVPYALHAKQSANGPQGLPGKNSISIVTTEPSGANCQNGGNKIDVGTDDNGDNLLQALEIDFTYYVCNGDSGSAAGDNWGNQVVITQGNNISGNGTTTNPLNVFDNDTSATNEIQDLSISGNTIGITGGTGINLSPTTPVTGQVLTWNGTAWIAQNAGSGADNWGTQVVISDSTLTGDGTTTNPLGVNGVLTDNQDLSLAGNSLSLTNDPTPVDLSPYLDNTDAQTLSINANILSISNGNTVTLPTPPTYTAGTGINLSGNIITNTAPDQTVAINSGTGINVTGTYPNFTVANTSPASSMSLTGTGITTVSGTAPSFTINTPAQTLTYNAPTLTLSNGGGTATIPPSPWIKTGSLLHPVSITDFVGIGVPNPSAPLHVINPTQDLTNIMIASRRPLDGGDAVLSFSEDSAGTQGMGIKYDGVWNRLDIGDGVFSTIPIMTITRSGNVGIGTISPAHRLHVAGNSFLDGVTQIGGTSGLSATLKVFSGFGSATAYFFDSGNNPSFTISSGGDVSVGQQTSVGKFFVQDNDANTTGASGSFISVQNLANTTNTSAGIRFRTGGSTAINGDFHYKGGIFFKHSGGTNGEGDMIFAVNNVASGANAGIADAVMTISRFGDVGIGTTPSSSYKLTVRTTDNGYAGYFSNSRTTTSSNYAIYANAQDATGSFNIGVYARASGAATTNYGLYGYATGGGTNWALYSLGPAYSSTGTWSGSDERLKTNIKSFNGAIEKLTQIDIKTYNFKTEQFKYLNFPSTKQYGVIAQNLEKVFPEMVLESEHFIPDENGDITDQTVSFKAVNYTQLIPVLIKAVQEQQQMIEELQKEIQELKNN